MKRKLNITINGKEYPMTYENEGNRYDVKFEAQEIQKYIPSSFFVKDNHVEFLSVSDKSQEIMNAIVRQINQHDG